MKLSRLALLLVLAGGSAHAQTKISAMPTATAIVGTELMPVIQSGANKVTTPSALLTYIQSQGGGSGTVTETGTHTSGSLAAFGTAPDIVTGNLSGDCTTSGTLAIVCTKTNAVAFTSAATTSIGTSGATIPLLSTANTWTLGQTYSAAMTYGGVTLSNAVAGTGSMVLSTSPTLVTPALGTPSALVGTNITGTAASLTAGHVTTNANLTGPITSTGNATAIGAQTGTGNTFVMDTSPTLVTPALGTPSALVGTNITGTASGFTAGHVTTNANLTGVITSSGNATSIAAQTGTGTTFVVDTSPTLVTPTLGVATVTSVNKWAFTAPATAITLTGTNNATYTFPAATSTLARTDAAQTFTGTQTADNIIDTGLTASQPVCTNGSKQLITTTACGLSASATAAVASPTGTSSTTKVMLAGGTSITPATTGRVMLMASGNEITNTNSDGCSWQLSYGTGTAPINGAALTGTQVGSIAATVHNVNTQKMAWSQQYVVTGLTVATAYWVDMAFAANVGGTCTLSNVNFSAVEF